MPTLCPFPHHATQVADALAIVLDPTSRPQQRLLAWAALKTARGQKMSQARIAKMQDDQLRQTTLISHFRDRVIGGAA